MAPLSVRQLSCFPTANDSSGAKGGDDSVTKGNDDGTTKVEEDSSPKGGDDASVKAAIPVVYQSAYRPSTRPAPRIKPSEATPSTQSAPFWTSMIEPPKGMCQ